jgi:hypothetical protein
VIPITVLSLSGNSVSLKDNDCRREIIMKKFLLLTGMAFAFAGVHQAVACEFGAHAANYTPITVADCGTGNCATDDAVTTQEPVADRTPSGGPSGMLV